MIGDRDDVEPFRLPGVEERQDVGPREPPRCFTRDDQALLRLVDDADAWDAKGFNRGPISARVVDNDDVVGWSGLGLQGKQAGRQVTSFVVRADDRGNRQRHRVGIGIARMIGRAFDRHLSAA